MSLKDDLAALQPGAMMATDFRDGVRSGARLALEAAIAKARGPLTPRFFDDDGDGWVYVRDLRALLAEVAK